MKNMCQTSAVSIIYEYTAVITRKLCELVWQYMQFMVSIGLFASETSSSDVKKTQQLDSGLYYYHWGSDVTQT